MILSSNALRLILTGIPRESGDDPTVTLNKHFLGLYSPRERG